MCGPKFCPMQTKVDADALTELEKFLAQKRQSKGNNGVVTRRATLPHSNCKMGVLPAGLCEEHLQLHRQCVGQL